jgi:hypothetical protein
MRNKPSIYHAGASYGSYLLASSQYATQEPISAQPGRETLQCLAVNSICIGLGGLAAKSFLGPLSDAEKASKKFSLLHGRGERRFLQFVKTKDARQFIAASPARVAGRS